MAVAENPQPLRFDINAAVVFRLGEELITDDVQALVELVKNSYDADATWVNVTIDTRAKNRWGVSGAPTPSGFQREIGVKAQGSSRSMSEAGWPAAMASSVALR